MMEAHRVDCVPSVISISYSDNEDSTTSEYMMRVNIEFQKVRTWSVQSCSLLTSLGFVVTFFDLH